MTPAALRRVLENLPLTAALTLTVAELWPLAEAEVPTATEQSEHNVDFTVEQLAAKLGRKPSTIRTWCAAGLLAGAYRFNSREWRIPLSALESMQRRQSEERAPRPKTSRKSTTTDLGEWRKHVRGSAS